jgi:integrase
VRTNGSGRLRVAYARLALWSGSSTVSFWYRYLALVRAVLKRVAGPWQWIEKAPTVSLYAEAKRRVRWLNKEEATRLLDALPTHQKQLTRFALATGLRQANVLGLKWSDVDMERRTAWVHADEAKGGEAIGVPLNDEAVAVLREELGKHPLRVSRSRASHWGRQTRGRGGMHSSVPASAIFAGTTCGTYGPRGTSWPVQRWRNCRNLARGSLKRW